MGASGWRLDGGRYTFDVSRWGRGGVTRGSVGVDFLTWRFSVARRTADSIGTRTKRPDGEIRSGSRDIVQYALLQRRSAGLGMSTGRVARTLRRSAEGPELCASGACGGGE